MAKEKSQLRSGVVLSYINMALGMVIPFLYTPVMLRMLGQAEYGLYSLSNSVISYLSLLSVGFGTTIIRYIAKYRAEDDKDKLQKTYGFFVLLYVLLAFVVLVCGSVIAFNVEPIFHKGLTDSELITMRSLIIIMTISTAISFPLSVVSSIIAAHERFVFRNLLAIVFTVLCPIANLIALWLGYKSVGMAAAGLLIQFISLPWNIIYCRRKLRVKPKYGKIPSGIIREMFAVSFYNLIGTLVNMLFWATDKVILGMLASSIAVAVYNVGATFCSMLDNISLSISGVLTPKVTGMVVKKASGEELTELFIRVGRLQFIIVGLAASGFVVFGQSFIRLWVGEEYSSAYFIALLVMLPSCIPLIQNTGTTILIAQNKQKFRSLVYLAIAIVNVVSTYLVVPFAGGVGAAFCSGVSVVLGQGFIMNTYYHRVTKLNIFQFWKTIIKMSVVPLALAVVGVLLLRFISINSWLILFLVIAIYTGLYILLEWAFVMNTYEKQVILNPIKNIKSKFLHRNSEK